MGSSCARLLLPVGLALLGCAPSSSSIAPDAPPGISAMRSPVMVIGVAKEDTFLTALARIRDALVERDVKVHGGCTLYLGAALPQDETLGLPVRLDAIDRTMTGIVYCGDAQDTLPDTRRIALWKTIEPKSVEGGSVDEGADSDADSNKHPPQQPPPSSPHPQSQDRLQAVPRGFKDEGIPLLTLLTYGRKPIPPEYDPLGPLLINVYISSVAERITAARAIEELTAARAHADLMVPLDGRGWCRVAGEHSGGLHLCDDGRAFEGLY